MKFLLFFGVLIYGFGYCRSLNLTIVPTERVDIQPGTFFLFINFTKKFLKPNINEILCLSNRSKSRNVSEELKYTRNGKRKRISFSKIEFRLKSSCEMKISLGRIMLLKFRLHFSSGCGFFTQVSEYSRKLMAAFFIFANYVTKICSFLMQ